MRSSDALAFIALSALWGASFMFMRVAVPEFGAAPLMLMRCAIGALTLIPILLWRKNWPDLKAHLFKIFMVGLFNSALPFLFFGFAAASLSSGVIAILNSTVPFWGALIAFVWFREVLTKLQILGLLVGSAGVFTLVSGGANLDGINAHDAALAVVAVLAATLSYGLSANYTKHYLANTNSLANATGSQTAATLWLLVPGLMFWPETMPGANAWLAVIILGVFSTGIAYLLFFRLIANLGATKAITVTFVIPVFGVFWGAVVLSEPVTARMVIGGLVVILGTALITGVLKARRPVSTTIGT